MDKQPLALIWPQKCFIVTRHQLYVLSNITSDVILMFFVSEIDIIVDLKNNSKTSKRESLLCGIL